MTPESAGPDSYDQLRQAVAAADPDAVFAPPRLIRRLVRELHPHHGTAFRVPHRRVIVLRAEQLRGVLDPADLGLATDLGDRRLIILERPSARELALRPRPALRLKFWRRLLHARLHLALDEVAAVGQLDAEAIREVTAAIGPEVYDEAIAVLAREHLLLEPADPVATFVEFAATFLELHLLAPDLIPDYFPRVHDPAAVAARLGRLVEFEPLRDRARPEGAADPGAMVLDGLPLGSAGQDGPSGPAPSDDAEARRSVGRERRLADRANRAAKAGNDVRASILLTRLARRATPARAGQARSEADAALDRLAARLQAAQQFDAAELAGWRAALRSLRDGASRGVWSAEARLLYDLQKVCLDHEREVFRIDLVEWALSIGRRSLRRHLPNQREVDECRHLRRASRRLRRVRLPEADRERLSLLMERALDRAEEGVRHRFRPLINRALDRADLMPRNLPERVARAKIEEELLDLVVERGHLTMGDVRDAISRNQVKLPDLNPRTFLRGDRLLRADQRINVSLEGVYRRGEFYLRGLQKGSSLAFGTLPGRWLTLFLILPFGGAFVLLEGLQHLIEPVLNLLLGPAKSHAPATPGGHPAPAHHVHLMQPWTVALLGMLFLGLIHHDGVRRLTLRLLRLGWKGLQAVLFDWPRRLLEIPALRAILDSTWFRRLRFWILEPLALTALLCWPISRAVHDPVTTAILAVISFLAATFLLNSRPGRNLREDVTDGLQSSWSTLTNQLLPGIYRAIMGFFDRVLDEVDRTLYSVDERLRFRSGESTLTLALKAIGTLLWSAVSYVVRFCTNLLLEPQINPIKHFPVVTVAHKVLLPFMLALIPVLQSSPFRMGPNEAKGLVAVVQLLLPGVFGFLIWELKENWRLYQANRSPNLQPVPIGHHGETMVRLLRPGFHSGTLPKDFARLRKAARTARETGRARGLVKARQELHHVELAVRHFVERELLGFFRESPGLRELPVEVAHVELSTGRVAVELARSDVEASPLVLAFEERAGTLVATTERAGWLESLGTPQRQVIAWAVAGLDKKAGVEVVREQVEAALNPPGARFRVSGRELIASPPDRPSIEVPLPLVLSEEPRPDAAATEGLTLDRHRLRFGTTPISWDAWVDAWQRIENGQAPPAPPVGPVLPESDRPVHAGTAGGIA